MNSAKQSSIEEGNTELLQEALIALRQTGYPQHRSLKLRANEGTVSIEGILPTYYLRQLALECIRRVHGVIHIVDHIRVIDEMGCDFPSADDVSNIPAESTTSKDADHD